MQTTRPPADLETPPGCWLWRSCQVNRHEGRGGQSGFRVNHVGKRDSGSDVENHLNLLASVHLKKKTKERHFWGDLLFLPRACEMRRSTPISHLSATARRLLA